MPSQATAQQTAECLDALNHGLSCHPSSYSTQAIYFNAKRYRSRADCLTAAYSVRLPLEICR
ncbi:MAG: hypothetical protein JOY64_21275 [Alphaproteobacteria bacterium]|nr:hypothetical protein [Alphaproteobacteria bacterium]MBV8410174.1 hypothetical protein [Alphaproteobacteria bacterium]